MNSPALPCQTKAGNLPVYGCVALMPCFDKGSNMAISSTSFDVPLASGASQHADALACRRCGVIDYPTITEGTGSHAYRANCAHCKAFLRWLSRYSPEERQARRQQARLSAMAGLPPSAMQLAYLRSLGHTGPDPANMAEASSSIDALLHGEGRR